MIAAYSMAGSYGPATVCPAAGRQDGTRGPIGRRTMLGMAGLDLVRDIAAADHYAVAVTARRDGGMQASVVSAGVMAHPLGGRPVVAFVARGGTVKLAHLRRRPAVSVIFRSGREWVTVEGTAELEGPDDPLPGFDAAGLPRLLREVFVAAGGTHSDWEEYDRVMAQERRCAVLVTPRRIYSRPGL